MKIVVTGHKGYIGSELFFQLQMKGYDPVGIDLKEGKDLLTYIPKNDVTVHCAATFTGKDIIEHNTNMTQKVLENTKRIIFLSSAAVYGNNQYAMVMDPLRPINPYGQSKAACEERIVHSEKEYSILRLSNVYSLHGGHGVVSRFLKGERTIYGTGKHVRDFIHISFVVECIIALIQTNIGNKVLNISSGKGITITTLFQRILPHKKPVYKKGKEEIAISVLDSSFL